LKIYNLPLENENSCSSQLTKLMKKDFIKGNYWEGSSVEDMGELDEEQLS
jgi:hypothetical protein